MFQFPKKISLYTLVVPILLVSLTAALPGCKEERTLEADLEFWGVFDDSIIYKPLIEEFNDKYSDIKVKYYKKNSQTYEKDLLDAMASGRGPDVFMIHHTWVPGYENKVQTAPSDLITLRDVQDNFVDVVYNDFVSQNNIIALPLNVDTLALYYNRDLFNTAGVAQPPQTWDDFLKTVEKITIKDERDNITRAGAAMGTARNINRSTDILALLMLQSGSQIVDQNTNKAVFDLPVNLNGEMFSPGVRSLEFYTNLSNPLKSVYTWNRRMHYSIDSFYEGKTAMMFNYSYHIPTIQAKAPYLNFGIAPMPQIKESTKDVNYANYWGLAVSHNSENPTEAWYFIDWLTQKENSKEYLEATKKPTARRDLISWQQNDPDLGVFAQQALTAHSWYQVDNSTIETIFADMIESVVLGEATVEDAIFKAAKQVTLLMKQ